jgi:parvulin-like peptidyl-prolyl isomerase
MKSPAVLLLSFCASLSNPVLAQDRPAESRPVREYNDAVAAKVNRTVITKSQVDREFGAALGRMSPADYERQFHQRLLVLVFGQIEQDAVERVGLVVPKRYIVEQLELQKEKKGAAEVMEGIKERGYKSEEEYLEAFGKEQSRSTYLAAQAGQFGSRAPQFRPDYWTEPTATEIRRYYRQHLADQFTQKNQAHLHAIALPYVAYADPPANPRAEVDIATGIPHVQEIAGKIRDELARGTTFATLARRYGHELKAEDGGDLGWISTDAPYPKELVDFAFNGPLKQLSEPILFPDKKAPRGIIVAWVEERATERVVPFSEAQSKIRDGLRAQRVEKARHKIVQKLLDDAYISPPSLKQDLIRHHNQGN